ncbi:MAG: DNA mismatch repair protein MutS [Bacilli bacterium]|nr:DNA mismatch repair protein MutS [Bacilli bacterium]
MGINEVDTSKITPMMKQYINIKLKNKEVIIFFRLGDFYEMFFEDALTVSRELELTLTGKSCGLEERVPMCGIPHHAANIYIDKLIEKGYKVGICEQLEDPTSAKGIVERDLVQIVSPGTIIDHEALVEWDNNYIGNILDLGYAYGISYADITTGEIYAYITNKNNNVVNTLVSLGLKEIIVDSKVDSEITNILKNQYKIPVTVTDHIEENEAYSFIYVDIDDSRYKQIVNHLLTYITNTQKRHLSHFQKLILVENNKYLKMDIHTKRNLELTETLRLKQRNYSLIWLLDKTKTAPGSRMLKSFLENPAVDINIINRRLDTIEILLKEFILKNDLVEALNNVYDLERLSGRIAFGSANARDLLQLKSSLKALPIIKEILEKIGFYASIETLDEIYELLDKSIYEEPPVTLKEGYLIKNAYNAELDELKELRKGGKDFVARFENEERERTGIKNLKVGYNRVFGYYIEVSKGNVSLVKEEYGYERRQTLANAERYISPILKEKEALILNAEEKIIELEYNLFVQVREHVKTYIPRIQAIAKVISEIDVLQSLATVAETNNFVRPELVTERRIEIIDGRHPVVEKVIAGEYVSNDVVMDEKTNILLITGPNMAGKSTYMRQLAIIVILAQIGSFVPARKAVLPVFDAIFTRIGASDDLVSGESTFMVEMLEANNAISNATKNSLILFDELGRGTATFDGMSLAHAIIEYVHNNIGAKTLFSTHYHELTDLETDLTNLKNVHVSALEESGKITFLHKIKEGSVDKSYGIHVAALANLPTSLIKRASEILNIYENKEKRRDVKIQESLPLSFEKEENEIITQLKEIDPNTLTPIDALNVLYKLKEKIK